MLTLAKFNGMWMHTGDFFMHKVVGLFQSLKLILSYSIPMSTPACNISNVLFGRIVVKSVFLDLLFVFDYCLFNVLELRKVSFRFIISSNPLALLLFWWQSKRIPKYTKYFHKLFNWLLNMNNFNFFEIYKTVFRIKSFDAYILLHGFMVHWTSWCAWTIGRCKTQMDGNK